MKERERNERRENVIISISVDIETSKRLQGSTSGAQYITIKILMQVIFNFVIFLKF